MPFLDTMTAVVKRVLGTSNDAMLRKLWPAVQQVTKLEHEFQQLDDSTLRERSAALRKRVVDGTSLDAIQIEALDHVRDRIRNVELSIRPEDHLCWRI